MALNRMIVKLVLFLISIYQKFISPAFPRRCRFNPTCSDYTRQAIIRYGVKGIWLGFRRIMRCHPWNDGGYDPVP